MQVPNSNVDGTKGFPRIVISDVHVTKRFLLYQKRYY
jgi:hypothetical protein